jgi:hypothetical protein
MNTRTNKNIHEYVILALVPSIVIFWTRAQLLTQKLIEQDYVAPYGLKIIATKIIRSSSQSG